MFWIKKMKKKYFHKKEKNIIKIKNKGNGKIINGFFFFQFFHLCVL